MHRTTRYPAWQFGSHGGAAIGELNRLGVSTRSVNSRAMDISFQDGPEARSWLRENRHDAAMAVNRFSSTAAALAFVEQLYAAGAKRVFIPQDTIIADEEELRLGGPYSDSMVIELEGLDVPAALEALYRKEATLEDWDRGHDPLPVIRDRFLFLWWD